MSAMRSSEILEAREAHAYWSHRAETLPWHRFGARREARELAARWRVRLVTARLESWRLGALTDFVVPFIEERRRRRRSQQNMARLALSVALVVGLFAHLVS
jgi:hypothetical protein